VIAYHPSRLHRHARELETYIDLCVEHGVKNQTVAAGLWDLSTVRGASLRSLVRDLNTRAVTTATGKVWTSKQPKDIIVSPRSPVYPPTTARLSLTGAPSLCW